jgi:hypothetical protein
VRENPRESPKSWEVRGPGYADQHISYLKALWLSMASLVSGKCRSQPADFREFVGLLAVANL